MSESKNNNIWENLWPQPGSVGSSANAGTVVDPEINWLISKIAVKYLNQELGILTVGLLEDLLNRRGSSLHNIGRNVADLSEPLYYFFGDRADNQVDVLLKHLFYVFGIPNEESYTRFDIGYAIGKLKRYAKENPAFVIRAFPPIASVGLER